MKTLLLTTLLISGIAFGQSKDLTKKQAFDLYKKSNVRIALGYKLSDFKDWYESGELTKETLILNSLNKKDLKELTDYNKCATSLAPNYVIETPVNRKKSNYREYFDIKCKTN
ncbi:hypothetical protein [Elizabethkingia anophelis]|uniref:hypothetical protein n=1 Tax=Elizabethkingia anophelis TaxID=1117645 RepID=UPI0038915102